jgi:hypothetical protein
LRQVAADAGIDQETVIRQRATRQQTAAWPALLRDRDRLAEALDASPSVSAVARRAGCSRESVRAAAAYHQIPSAGRPSTRPAPVWTAQPPAPPAPPAGADTEPLETTLTQLHDANASRTRTAAARTVDAARRALLNDRACRAQHRAVLQARVDHPQASLAELGAIFGTSKDAYAAMLRRALTGRRSA